MDTVAALAALIAYFYYLRIAHSLSQFHNSKLFVSSEEYERILGRRSETVR